MNTRSSSYAPFVSALVVGAIDKDQTAFEKIFLDCGWKLGRARSLREANEFMDSTPVGVVISERDLPEGGWREMLNDLMQRTEPPPLLVTSRLADDALWAEVLNIGGYDVLAKPLDSEEVARVVSAAARHFDHECQRRHPQSHRPVLLKAAC